MKISIKQRKLSLAKKAALGFLSAALLTGCSSTSATESAKSSTSAAAAESTASATEEAEPAAATAATEAATAAATEAADSYYPVTVDTYDVSSDGSTWTAATQTFNSEPQRVVANNQGTANLLIRLGLADKIVGVAAVYGPAPDDVADEFNQLNVIAQGYASKEAVQGVNPDMVCGRGDLFIDGDYGIGTVDELNQEGIMTYINHVGETGATFTSFLEDIENYGTIFNVQEKAQELEQYYTDYTEKLKNDSRWAGKTMKVAECSYIQDGVPVFGTAATETLQNEALAMIGLDNINADCEGDSVSLETVIAENPQVIILFDYEGGPDMDEMIQSLYDNAQLQDIDAIKNHKVFSTDFSAVYGGGGDLYTAMSDLADEVYGK